MNSDHNTAVVKITFKLKRTNTTKRSEELELNLLKKETYKNKYNVEVHNIYERLFIEETELTSKTQKESKWMHKGQKRKHTISINQSIKFL